MLSAEILSLKKKFIEWRTDPKSNKRRIPSHLRKEVLNILNHSPVSHVLVTLGISTKQIHLWRKELNIDSNKQDILLYSKIISPTSCASPDNKEKIADCIAEIELKNGEKIRFFSP